jgi:hypothetical protein
MPELIITQDNILKALLVEDLTEIDSCLNYRFDWEIDIWVFKYWAL